MPRPPTCGQACCVGWGCFGVLCFILRRRTSRSCQLLQASQEDDRPGATGRCLQRHECQVVASAAGQCE
eukprot:8005065-Pyramimonas_sp.AAC.1